MFGISCTLPFAQTSPSRWPKSGTRKKSYVRITLFGLICLIDPGSDRTLFHDTGSHTLTTQLYSLHFVPTPTS